MNTFLTIKDADTKISQLLRRMRLISDEIGNCNTREEIAKLEAEHQLLSEEVDQSMTKLKEMSDDIFAERKEVINKNFFGVLWPKNAAFGVTILYHTWPMGWDKSMSKRFFKSREELELHLGQLQIWALSEDNKAKVNVYKWEESPQLIADEIYQ